MTPEQKRAHLTLLGWRAYIHIMSGGLDRWRLTPWPMAKDTIMLKYLLVRGWFRSSASSRDSYSERPLTDVPDDLLDSLELSEIEHPSFLP